MSTELETAVFESLERHRGVPVEGKHAVGAMRTAKGWTLGTLVIEREAVEVKTLEEERAHHGAPESWLWLGRLDSEGRWTVTIEWTPAFYDALRDAPAELFPTGERTTFESDGVSLAAVQANAEADNGEVEEAGAAPLITGDPYTDIMLPWSQGESWRLRGGPHGWAGCYRDNQGRLVCPRPWSSLDLNGRDNVSYPVKAAGNGILVRPCSSGTEMWLRIKHGNGWETEYYHLDRVPANLVNGVQVWRTTMLGWTGTRIDCGGAASGPHVHFAIRFNGAYVEWNGRTIGGWTIRQGAAGYAGVAERADFNGNVRRARAQTPDPMYNMGVRFQVHMQNIGWMTALSNFALAGQASGGLRLEAIKIALQRPDGCPPDPDIAYDAHVQDIGWQGERRHDQVAGTEGQNRRIEAIRIRLVNPPAGQHVAYKVFMEGIGWGPLVFDGAVAGTTGQSRRIEAIQIGLLP